MNYRLMKNTGIIFLLFLLSACNTTLEKPPKNTDNICAIFNEKTDWLNHTEDVSEKWGLPIHVQMAIMHQESHFVANARPPRKKVLGFIPGPRLSSAYGYAQALDETWNDYLRHQQDDDLSRDNFSDACNFTGWYCHASYKELGISKLDAYNLYLAYHEGRKAYKQKTYLNKLWLLAVANKVALKAQKYRQQLDKCRN